MTLEHHQEEVKLLTSDLGLKFHIKPQFKKRNIFIVDCDYSNEH